MFRYILRRLGQSLLALLTLVLIVFLTTRLTGNPTDLYLPISATPEARAQFTELHGFNDPLYIQFFRFVGDLLRGDFGDSLFQARPAMQVALEAFPWTLSLAGITMVLALALALVLGSLAAIRPNGVMDRVVSVLTILSASLPSFWVAIVAILVFAIFLRWLPTSGPDSFRHWIMPVGVLLLQPLGIMIQVVRSSMVGSLAAAYVKTAQAKGASGARVVFVHALRNALLPVVTVAAVQASYLINGAVVVETIFGFPGIGRLMIESIRNRDYSLSIACILLTAVVVYTLNTLIDLLYSRLDPRVRTN